MATERSPLEQVKPYPLNADGTLPKWFTPEGAWDPNKFDAGELYVPKGEMYELASNPGVKLESPFDLRNLRIIDPESVLYALETLEEQSANGNSSLCFIGTGGTISMVLKGDTKRPELDIDKLLSYSGRELLSKFNRASFSFPALIDSSQMKIDYDADIVIAISYLWKKMSEQTKKGFMGFVVAHGTDSMAQSAARVQMMLGSNIEFSVGFVGSQKTIDEDRNDVASNVNNCIVTLDSLFRADRNTVFIFMGGDDGSAYHPCGARKRSDQEFKAFESPAIAPISGPDGVLHTPFADEYKGLRHVRVDFFQPVIARGFANSRLIEADMDVSLDRLRRDIVNSSEDLAAIIMRTYGSFTFDRQQVDVIIDTSRSSGLAVFVTNPFPVGRIDHKYADAQYLIEKGAIPLFMMPHAAVAKLVIAQRIFGRDVRSIEEFMTSNNYVGEQPDQWTPRDFEVPVIKRVIGQPEQTLPDVRLNPIP